MLPPKGFNVPTASVSSPDVYLSDLAQSLVKFASFDIEMPADSPLHGIGVVYNGNVYVTLPENADRTALKAVFTTKQPGDVVKVNGVVQQSGVTINNFSESVTYTIVNQSGESSFIVSVGDWSNIPGHFAEGDVTKKAERPYFNDYTKTLTMKLFMASPGTNGTSNVRLKFDEALELIRQVDNLTAGIPKIFYLVGWQFTGHDDKYPSWAVVNDALTCTSCSHATAEESLSWLMQEAIQYNSRVSLHINSTDAYVDSPLWNEYLAGNLISKNGDGSLMEIGNYNGEVAYQVNYKNEWESGKYKQRVDQLLQMLPLLRIAGTIHMDAFFARASQQSTLLQEQEARLKMMRYWYDNGIDVTSEFLYATNGSSETNNDGCDTGLIGVMPMTWHFNQSNANYMSRPASLVTGCGINEITYGDDRENVEILFGRSMWGEDLLTSSEIVGPTPNWDVEFLHQFATQTVPWAYQNQFARLSLQGSGSSRIATYSDQLVATLETKTITKDGFQIRQDNNIFVPAAWSNTPKIIAYSLTGYQSRTWTMPLHWSAAQVNIYTVTNEGYISNQTNVALSNRELTLSLNANEMVVITPNNVMP